jgi:hypothetical protein
MREWYVSNKRLPSIIPSFQTPLITAPEPRYLNFCHRPEPVFRMMEVNKIVILVAKTIIF